MSKYTRKDLFNISPQTVRQIISNQQYNSPTNGCCQGYLQANVVILGKKFATDFQTFCELNPRSAPLLEVLQPGNPFTAVMANNADIRCCLPKYRIHKKSGTFEDVNDINNYWNDDMVAFLVGCSFSFEAALENNGINMRHRDLQRNVPMYDTNISTNNTKWFGHHVVVSMRPIKKAQMLSTYKITERFPSSHGSPIHFGDPNGLGIKDINKPDYGDFVAVKEGELPAFWACGVTTQVAVKNAIKMGVVDQVITHAPGHMFISDLKADDTQSVRKLKYSKL